MNLQYRAARFAMRVLQRLQVRQVVHQRHRRRVAVVGFVTDFKLHVHTRWSTPWAKVK